MVPASNVKRISVTKIMVIMVSAESGFKPPKQNNINVTFYEFPMTDPFSTTFLLLLFETFIADR